MRSAASAESTRSTCCLVLRQKRSRTGWHSFLTRADKERHAQTFAPTTLFEFLYRLRLAASYGEADVFVLGARDESDARRLAVSLAVICDATVAALEALIAAYAGPELLADAADRYSDRTGSSLVSHRAEAWRRRASRPSTAAASIAVDDEIPF